MNVAEIAPDDPRLPHAFEVMGELRAHLSLDDFRRLYDESFPQGYRIAAVIDGDDIRAVAGYRIATNLVSGKHLYVDDLVTAEEWRSHGYGRRLNEYLIEKARSEGCGSVQLDSAVHRAEAHRFYFREHYRVAAFHFLRPLDGESV